jgi:hypothetical protein
VAEGVVILERPSVYPVIYSTAGRNHDQVVLLALVSAARDERPVFVVAERILPNFYQVHLCPKPRPLAGKITTLARMVP